MSEIDKESTSKSMYPELGNVWPSLTEDDKLALFTETRDTILCCHNKNGTIHASPIWFRYKDNKFYIVTFNFAKKTRNIMRDDAVTLSIVKQGEGEVKTSAAIIYGKGEVELTPDYSRDSLVYWVWSKYRTTPEEKDQLDQSLSRFDDNNILALITVNPTKIVHYYP